jgi:cytochrome d ubiquinol oxidase subunit I
VIAGLVASVVQIFPTGDLHARYLAFHQPPTTAAVEGLFHSERGAPIVLVGQPEPERGVIDNPIAIHGLLSYLIYGTVLAEVRGLDAFPQRDWPDNIPLLFFAYHIMAGLGTLFVALMCFSAVLLSQGRLYQSRLALWLLMLAFPFPFIANTAGWLAAELGRQPWLVYGALRTEHGYSTTVTSGSVWFTLLGFMGMYALLALSFVFLLQRLFEEGPA